MASTRLLRVSMATTLGSLMTMPRWRTVTSMLARAEIDPDVVAEEAEQAVEESHGPSGIVLHPPVARRGWHEDGLRLRGTTDAGKP